MHILILFDHLCLNQAKCRAIPVNHEEGTRNGAENATTESIPSKLKAVIKFVYDEGMKKALAGKDFDAYIQNIWSHTLGRFRHPSLGTIIEFEVCKSTIVCFSET